jgi:hypothetical protein
VDRTARVRILGAGYESTVDPNFKDDPALVEEAEDETNADDEAEAETKGGQAADRSDDPRSSGAGDG